MAFLANLGYSFDVKEEVKTDGSIILASAMPMHQLERRKFKKNQPHLKNRYFDPQLYLATYDAARSKKHCTNLASYPWFDVNGYQDYRSSQQNQKEWKKLALQTIVSRWKQTTPTDLDVIKEAVRECIDFQERKGVCGIILPSPLTADPGTNYNEELLWLDTALEYMRDRFTLQPSIPVFATIAITDSCLKYMSPIENSLLSLILDAISAREVDGVYLIVEQGSESDSLIHCGHYYTKSVSK